MRQDMGDHEQPELLQRCAAKANRRHRKKTIIKNAFKKSDVRILCIVVSTTRNGTQSNATQLSSTQTLRSARSTDDCDAYARCVSVRSFAAAADAVCETANHCATSGQPTASRVTPFRPSVLRSVGRSFNGFRCACAVPVCLYCICD